MVVSASYVRRRLRLGLLAPAFFVAVSASGQEWAWVQQIGNFYSTAGRTLAVDAKGNAVVNAGNYERYLAKFDPDGKLLWTQRGYGRDIALDSDGNLFATSLFTGTVTFGDNNVPSDTNLYKGSLTLINPLMHDASFLVKLGADGTVLWGRQTEGWVARSWGVAADSAGCAVVVGSFQGWVNFSSQSCDGTNESRSITLTNRDLLEDTFLAKYSPKGDLLWAQNGGGQAVTIDRDGNIIVSGVFYGSLSFGNGDVTLTSGTNSDMYLAKYDSQGRLLWVRQQTTPGSASLSDRLGIDQTDNIYTKCQVGLYPSDFYLTKFAPDGSPLWTNILHGSWSDLRLSVSPAGELHIAGDFAGPVIFADTSLSSRGPQSDIFLVKYDSAGKVVWAKQVGGVNAENKADVSVGPGADVWLAAGFFDNTVIGGQSLANPGWHTFLSRLALGLPMILSQPLNVRTNPGSAVTFSVTVTNATNPLFQWRKDGLDLADGERVAGTATTCLTIHDVRFEDAGNYSLTVKAENGTVSSSAAALWFGPRTQFVAKTMLTNGIFQVDFIGEPGRFYNIEASTNPRFPDADTITNFFCGQGFIRIIDWDAAKFSNRFYRAVSSQ